ncbi:MAG: polysaccharide deacetylase family protein [Pseudomonadales bacterium]|nr:polysaccharide deacetylase family protein [Pseudomonadales bacterium]
MSHLVALMYHAIYANETELETIPEEDRPYAISTHQFEQQLEILKKQNIPVLEPQAINQTPPPIRGVILTFDDGDQSFFKHAYRILNDKGHKAMFFISTDLIDQRDDFCTWDELKEMAEAGMLIQCHGQTHRFFDDLTEQESRSEFHTAQQTLQQHTGQKVYAISFPGGRYTEKDIAVGKSLGYTCFYTSEIGTLQTHRVNNSSPLPRLPIRQNTSEQEFLLMASADSRYIRKETFKNFLKKMMKNILGNTLYHSLYKAVTG